jgi:hypothetical protein
MEQAHALRATARVPALYRADAVTARDTCRCVFGGNGPSCADTSAFTTAMEALCECLLSQLRLCCENSHLLLIFGHKLSPKSVTDSLHAALAAGRPFGNSAVHCARGHPITSE